MDTARANAITTSVNAEFAAIGHANNTRMPRAKGNMEPVAWEFHIASHALRQAEARKKKAHAAAVKAGVLFDHEALPRPAGTEAVVYAGELVRISLSVTAAATKLDLPELLADLERAGLKRLVINRLVTRHTTDNRAPHKFTSALVTG